MKKKLPKKLVLNKETVRKLNDAELEQVSGAGTGNDVVDIAQTGGGTSPGKPGKGLQPDPVSGGGGGDHSEDIENKGGGSADPGDFNQN